MVQPGTRNHFSHFIRTYTDVQGKTFGPYTILYVPSCVAVAWMLWSPGNPGLLLRSSVKRVAESSSGVMQRSKVRYLRPICYLPNDPFCVLSISSCSEIKYELPRKYKECCRVNVNVNQTSIAPEIKSLYRNVSDGPMSNKKSFCVNVIGGSVISFITFFTLQK